MQSQPQQIIVQQPPTPTFISQPAATLIGSVVVLCGILASLAIGIATLKQNARKVRNEQYEKRAKEREQALLIAYSDFIGAGLDALHVDRRMVRWNSDVPSPFGGHKEAWVEAGRKLAEETSMAHFRVAKARAKLLMMESDHARYAKLGEFSIRLTQIRADAPNAEAEINQLAVALQRWATEIGESLHDEYRVAAASAERGELPPRTVRWKPSPPATEPQKIT
jgi:hypothetical protein